MRRATSATLQPRSQYPSSTCRTTWVSSVMQVSFKRRRGDDSSPIVWPRDFSARRIAVQMPITLNLDVVGSRCRYAARHPKIADRLFRVSEGAVREYLHARQITNCHRLVSISLTFASI